MWTRSYIRCRCEYKHKTQTGDSVRKAFLSHPDGPRTQSCNASGTHLWAPRAIPCGWERKLKFGVLDAYCLEILHLAMRGWRGPSFYTFPARSHLAENFSIFSILNLPISSSRREHESERSWDTILDGDVTWGKISKGKRIVPLD